MHEMALAREIVAIVERAAKDHKVRRIRLIRLALGAFGHVEVPALRFAFLAAAKDTIAEGAELDISRPAGQALCHNCQITVTLESRLSPCPLCGGVNLDVVGGAGFRVVDMEIE